MGFRLKRPVNRRYFFGALLLPFLAAGLFWLVAVFLGFTRYDPAYFTPEYLQRYRTPGDVISGLEQALRSGDANQLAEIQATRRIDPRLEPLPELAFVMVWEQAGKYTNYLFFDQVTYHRYMKHLRQVNGRYVEVPEGWYYYADSGRWVRFFWPAAIIWWTIIILMAIGVRIYRSMALVRKRMFEGHLD